MRATKGEEKRVLLVDTGFAARPIYDWLIGVGLTVWTMGNRPDDIVARKAGEFYVREDYSDVAAVQRHVDRLGITHIVPGCTDVSIETCVRLRVPGTRLDSPEVCAKLGHKAQFRDLCRRLDAPSPRVLGVEQFPYPGAVIVKPVDSFSGQGVAVCDGGDIQAVAAAVTAARKVSPTDGALVETFVEGQLHSYTAFVEQACVTEAFLVEEGSSANPFAVDTSYVSDRLPAAALEVLRRNVEKIATDLKLVDGLVHVQFIWDGKAPHIVEMSRRCPGDLYALLIEYTTGYRYAGKYASYFVSEPCAARRERSEPVLRHTVTAGDAPFGKILFDPPANVLAYYPIASLGHLGRPGRLNRVGLLFLSSGSRAKLDETYGIFLSRRAYDTD